VLSIAVSKQAEAGLLGLAVRGRALYLYVTVDEGGPPKNRVERWTLSADARSATRDRVIFDGIAAATFHDGGRLRFGPDGMLYVATGDAREPDSAQRRSGPNGKLLRITPEGAIPKDNPFTGEATFLWGIRNLQAFDWVDDRLLVLADHGPSGELGRSGHDEIDFARAGDNLGWPTLFGCEAREGMVSPLLTWTNAVPPGGGAVVRGDAIPGWKGSFVIGSLGARALHRFELDGARITAHEVYFKGDPPSGLGRLRDVVSAPDGALWITTSNCDGRGTCPATKDAIVRIVPG
jgi:glucose/arabinose dehydrogenase